MTDSFRTYVIKSSWKNLKVLDYEVHRRYSHFEWFREQLLKKYEICALPVLPDKSFFNEKISGNDSKFVKARIRKLQHFFTILASHPTLRSSPEVIEFLTEKDTVYDSNWQSEIEEKNSKNSGSIWSKASDSFKSLYKKASEIKVSKIISTM